MATLQYLLAKHRTLIADSSLCTHLFDYKQLISNPPSLTQLIDSDQLAAIQASYFSADVAIVMTNTFDANRFKLALLGLGTAAHQVNERSAALLRQAISGYQQHIAIGGSIGPISRHIAHADAVNGYAEQAEALASGGVDFLWLESFSTREQAEAAIFGCELGAPHLPLVVTFSFADGKRLPVGVLPIVTANALCKRLSVLGVGADTGAGQRDVVETLAQMKISCVDKALVAKIDLNTLADRPSPNSVDTESDLARCADEESPKAYAAFAVRAAKSGARIIATSHDCTAAHLSAISRALKHEQRAASTHYNKSSISPKM